MNKIKIIFLTFIMYFGIANQVLAADVASVGFSVKDFLQPVFSLLFVIIMIYGAFFAYSKLNNYNIQKFSNLSQKSIELSKLSLISHLPLGQNKSIDVVKINGKYLVLGVTGDNISLIKEFSENDKNIGGSEASFGCENRLFDDKNSQNKELSHFKNTKINELYEKYLRGSNDVQS